MPPGAASHGRLLSGLPDGAAGEEFLPLAANGTTRIERIVSTGQASPPGFWYDQEEDEFVLLVAGRAVLAIAERSEPLVLEPGDWVNLPARCRHRVEWTSAEPPTIWLAVFSPAGG
jgi:cupin 2 domain-containing protein